MRLFNIYIVWDGMLSSLFKWNMNYSIVKLFNEHLIVKWLILWIKILLAKEYLKKKKLCLRKSCRILRYFWNGLHTPTYCTTKHILQYLIHKMKCINFYTKVAISEIPIMPSLHQEFALTVIQHWSFFFLMFV